MCDFRCEHITLHIEVIRCRWWRWWLGRVDETRGNDEIIIVIGGRGEKEVNIGGEEEKTWRKEKEGTADETVVGRRRGEDKTGIRGLKAEGDTRTKTKEKIKKIIVID